MWIQTIRHANREPQTVSPKPRVPSRKAKPCVHEPCMRACEEECSRECLHMEERFVEEYWEVFKIFCIYCFRMEETLQVMLASKEKTAVVEPNAVL